MAKSNRQRVDEALILVAEGFGAFAEDQLQRHWGNGWMNEVKANTKGKFDFAEGRLDDPDFVLWLGINQWRPVFYKLLSESDRAAISFLRDTRVDWAHNKKAFTTDETHRVIDFAHMLLSSCGAVEQAAQLDEQRQEVLRLKFEEQTRRVAAKSAEGVSVGGAVGGLKPWREVIEPHEDVANGTFQLAEFAANLREVHAGTARDEYGDPVEFFRRTYLTRGLRTLLVQTLRRMNAVGGDPVVDLMTTFGGGKTHSLLAVYHLCGGHDATELAGMAELAREIGVEGMPAKIGRAVVVGNDVSARGEMKSDGTQVNTLWGELAWQLGGKEAFETIRADDEARTSPKSSDLVKLLTAHAPCIVLIDEWIAYARQLWNREDLAGGSLDTHMTFAQALTEAVKSVPNALLVVSIPASDTMDGEMDENSHEIGGVGGLEALRRLRAVVHRVESPWQPASADESFEIVRRRLFQSISPDDLVHRDVTCRRFGELYAKHPSEFPAEVRQHDYEQRIKNAYPIHPELFDRLYQDWSALERFQRTRGVLRLMATVVHALWNRNDQSPMILPSTVPLDDVDVFEEVTNHLDDNWKPVVDVDVAGSTSLPAMLDRENTTLGRVQASQRVARAIFLGSAPDAHRRDSESGTQTPSRGIENLRIALGSAFPGDTPAVFGDALRRLNERARYLNSEGSRYWLSTQQTVSELARGKAEGYDEREIIDDLAGWIRRETDRGEFARIHRFPTDSGDIEDEQSVALVILGAAHTHARNTDSAGLAAALDYTKQRGARARQHQNMLVFLAADASRLPDLLAAARMHKAWTDVQTNKESYNLDQHNIRLAASNLERWEETIRARVSETYVWMLVPRQEPGGPLAIDVLKINGTGTLAERASKKAVDNDLLVTRYAASNLRMELDRVPLWRDGSHVGVAQVWDDFSRYPYLPRLRGQQVLLEAVQDGPMQLNAEHDGFGYADSFDAEAGRYRGLILHDTADKATPTGVVVEYSAAHKQWQADKEAAEGESGNGGAGGGETGGKGGDGDGDGSGGTGSKKITRFTALKEIDAVRAGRDAAAIADEVIAHFTDRGAKVTVVIEIEAEDPEGFDEGMQRTVTENASTLGFDRHDFE
jgi:predicted AAA+ superfamily ATPase